MENCILKCKQMLKASNALPTAVIAVVASAVTALTTGVKEVQTIVSPKKETKMKKSTILTIVIVLAAVAGALAAAYFYLARRERELNEYEELLFSEDLTEDLNLDDEAFDSVGE